MEHSWDKALQVLDFYHTSQEFPLPNISKESELDSEINSKQIYTNMDLLLESSREEWLP